MFWALHGLNQVTGELIHGGAEFMCLFKNASTTQLFPAPLGPTISIGLVRVPLSFKSFVATVSRPFHLDASNTLFVTRASADIRREGLPEPGVAVLFTCHGGTVLDDRL